MTKLGATEAAKRWGVSRQLIYKDWKRGKLAYTVDDCGQKQVDVSELLRVYGEPSTNVSDDNSETDNHVNTPQSDTTNHYLDDYIATLKQQLIEKEIQLKVKDQQISERDRQVQSLINQIGDLNQRLLPAPEDDYIEDEPEPEKPRRRWWQFGRKVEEV